MDNEEHKENQDQVDSLEGRTGSEHEHNGQGTTTTTTTTTTSTCCSKEWCRSSIFSFLIFLSENRPIAYVAAFLFLLGIQLASMEDITAFMSLDLCLSPSTITIISPIKTAVLAVSVGGAGFVLARVGALSGLCFAGFVSMAGLLFMSFANVSIIFFFVGLLLFSTLGFSQVAYLQFISARVDPSVVAGVQASLGSIFALGMVVGKPLFLFLFAWPSLPNHYLFLIGAGLGIPATAVIMYLKWTMSSTKKKLAC